MKYLILAGAALGIYGLTISKDLFARIIIIIMLVAIGLNFIPLSGIGGWGFLIYTAGVTLSAIYAFVKKLPTQKKVMILLIAIPIIVLYIFKTQHWPYVNQLRMANIIAIIPFIICLTQFRKYKNEFGFMAIMSCDALINVLLSFTHSSFN